MSAKKQKVADVEATQKQCLTVLQQMKRKKEAIFFLAPVDWKALELPLYPKLIKKPMDLGTVEQKLHDSAYKTVAEFVDDVNLVWSNAQIFNLEGSDIYNMAQSCKEAFEGKMADVDDQGALREKKGGGGGGGGGSLSGDEYAAVKKVVVDLKRMKNAELFLSPVDWKSLGLLDYPLLVKKPMDLGTIHANIEAGKYASAKAVAADVDLVWANAMTYNIDGSFIYDAANSMMTVSKDKFAPILEGGGGGGGGGGSSSKDKGGTPGGGAPTKEKGGSSGGGGALSAELLACKKVVADLSTRKNAELFLSPVDWKSLGLLDYPVMIKKPMDLGTISANIESGKYASALDVAADVRQLAYTASRMCWLAIALTWVIWFV